MWAMEEDKIIVCHIYHDFIRRKPTVVNESYGPPFLMVLLLCIFELDEPLLWYLL